MVTFPIEPPIECSFHNLIRLLEYVAIWMILIFEINVYLPNFSNRVIGIIIFERIFSELNRRDNVLVSKGAMTWVMGATVYGCLLLTVPRRYFYCNSL